MGEALQHHEFHAARPESGGDLFIILLRSSQTASHFWRVPRRFELEPIRQDDPQRSPSANVKCSSSAALSSRRHSAALSRRMLPDEDSRNEAPPAATGEASKIEPQTELQSPRLTCGENFPEERPEIGILPGDAPVRMIQDVKALNSQLDRRPLTDRKPSMKCQIDHGVSRRGQVYSGLRCRT